MTDGAGLEDFEEGVAAGLESGKDEFEEGIGVEVNGGAAEEVDDVGEVVLGESEFDAGDGDYDVEVEL